MGYGAFPLSIIEYLWRAKQPYNVSVAAEVSACAALQNPIYLEVFLFVLLHISSHMYVNWLSTSKLWLFKAVISKRLMGITIVSSTMI